MIIETTVNGKKYTEDVEPRMLLVDFIRNSIGLKGTKIGDDEGITGACTVLLNGKAIKSSMMLAVQCDGAEIITIEGLAQNGQLHPIQQCFWEKHAVQNGFEETGIILSMVDFLKRVPDPTEPEIRSWLDGNISRITGYQNIVEAIILASRILRGEKVEFPEDTSEHISGASIKTREAPSLLKGEAKFIGDIELPNMLHLAILRSKYAHANITKLDISEARKMPGVIRIITGADIEGKIMPLPVIWVPQDVVSHFPPHPSGMVPGSQAVIATNRVRFVGELLAGVVAETFQQAEDAVGKIIVEYELLPVVIDAEEALSSDAPQLHDTVPNNLAFNAHYGDKELTDKAIAEAEVVVNQKFHNQRMSAHPVETRGALGNFEASTGEYTLWNNIQPLYPVRLLISLYVLGIPYDKLRVIAPNNGGSQGCKGYLYPEAPLVLYLSRELGRPVKWIETRSEFSRSTVQGRDQKQHLTLAGTIDGKITAVSCIGFSNIGAYPVINAPGQPRTLIGRSLPGSYMIPNSYYEVNVVFTNTVQVGPLRGSGRAEATFAIERLVDLFARKIRMDPAEVRRINMVPPDKFPFSNGLGWNYDSGDYRFALDKALDTAGYANRAAVKQEAKERGKLLGYGIGSYVAVAGVGPSQKMGAEGLVSGTWGVSHVKIQPTGTVTITIGSQPHGQSHETTFSQIAAEVLGIPVEMISILHSDTAGALYFGQGSYGSRSLSVEGTAVHKACVNVIEKVKKHAAHLFKMPVEIIDYKNGKVFATVAPDKAVMTLQQVAFTLWLAWDLAEGMDPGLESIAYFDPPEFNFPYGTHVAIVEVDEHTGNVDVVRYITVDDFGNVINPGVVDGQTHGNITLGIGQALYEGVVYSSDGQILNDTLETYLIPKASQLPHFETDRTVTPSPVNALGAKGAGDVSNPPVAPAIVNAVCDALSEFGIEHIDMPLRPEKIWKAIQTSKKKLNYDKSAV